jgi:hypothetical protein
MRGFFWSSLRSTRHDCVFHLDLADSGCGFMHADMFLCFSVLVACTTMTRLWHRQRIWLLLCVQHKRFGKTALHVP